MGNLEEAEKKLQKAIELDPEHGCAVHPLSLTVTASIYDFVSCTKYIKYGINPHGSLLTEMDRLGEAENNYKKAIGLDPQAAVMCALKMFLSFLANNFWIV